MTAIALLVTMAFSVDASRAFADASNASHFDFLCRHVQTLIAYGADADPKTSDASAFERAIVLVPEEDLPRLAYADAIEEGGNSVHAEFIRVQVELTRDISQERRAILEDRERMLLTFANYAAWMPPEIRPLVAEQALFTYQRGFIGHVTLQGSRLRNRENLVALQSAPITSLKVTGEFYLNELTAVPEGIALLKRLKKLELSNSGLPFAELTTIAACPHLKQLTQLDLRGNSLGDEGIRALANSSVLTNLVDLKYGDNGLTPTGTELLAQSSNFSNLRNLDLNLSNLLGDAGVQPLTRSQNLKKLSSLNLSNTNLGDIGVSYLAQSSALQNLTSLSLAGNRITPAGIVHLTSSDSLTKLTSLNLANNHLFAEWRPEVIERIANARNFAGIATLLLHENFIGPEGARHLAESPYLNQLVVLDVGACGIEDSGLIYLVNSPNLKKLKSLELRNNDLSDAAAAAIAASPNLGELNYLGFGGWRGNRIGDDGAVHLGASRGLSNLRVIDLQNNRIEDVGAESLAAAVALPKLDTISLIGNRVSPQSLERVAAALHRKQHLRELPRD